MESSLSISPSHYYELAASTAYNEYRGHTVQHTPRTAYVTVCTPAFGQIRIRIVIIGIRLNTVIRDIVGVYLYVWLSLEIKCSCHADPLERPVPSPGSRAAITLSPSLDADLLGCTNRIREKERKKESKCYTIRRRTVCYKHSSLTTDQYYSEWLIGGSGAPGNSTSTWLQYSRGNNLCRCHSYRAEIQWLNEVWRRETKRRNLRNIFLVE